MQRTYHPWRFCILLVWSLSFARRYREPHLIRIHMQGMPDRIIYLLPAYIVDPIPLLNICTFFSVSFFLFTHTHTHALSLSLLLR
ncbi:hypothetical protein F5X96DRAFT_656488 [Biscogniauxia mediterranea]|nr:hypothetical protein F5X96DRAFT_656488 [Biscogniauxia mediterranea]